MITLSHTNNLPSTMGVYIFIQQNKPIYIGKSINIRARVLSHIKSKISDPKEKLIIKNSDKITFIPTIYEFEALILESHLIKIHKPKYNLILRDTTSSLYIKITVHELYPKVYLVRKENDNLSKYFGPFNSNALARKLLSDVRRVIPFCTTKKITKRPCFYSHLGLCNPCPSYINKISDKNIKNKLTNNYRNNIKQLVTLFSNESTKIFTIFNRELAQAILNKDWDKALELRNQLSNINSLLSKRYFSADYMPKPYNITSVNNKLKTFIQTYFDISIPKETLRIEAYDVSQLNNTNATSSMVVFDGSYINKSEYRKFRIKNNKSLSDTSMLSETIIRRFKNTNLTLPDLIVIDGGKSQCTAVIKALSQLKIEIPVICVVKNPDRIYICKDTYKFCRLKRTDDIYKIFISLRDEAHRFARKYHLLLRDKNLLA